MIINGGSRSNGAFFARHLMRADHNERVTVAEMRGFGYAQDVPDAFRELRDLASGTQCKNFFYHANINPNGEMTPERWAQAVDALEQQLRLDGQPRFIVEHEKEGRTHRHVVWSRIDTDTMTAISDSHTYRTHELVASELEERFGHAATARALTRDKEETPRPEANVKDWESFRAAESRIDPKAMKAELTELWQHSDSGPAFAAALEERGYRLARGDRRDFCIIDQAGDEHSLGRRVGVKAAEIRARMADVDRDALPSVAEARELARKPPEEPAGTAGDSPQIEPVADAPAGVLPVVETSPFEAIMTERMAEERRLDAVASVAADRPQRESQARPAFDTIMDETLHEAAAAAEEARAAPAGGRWERFSSWLTSMREHVAGYAHQVRDYWNSHFGHPVPEPEPAGPHETPTNTVQTGGMTVEPMQQNSGPEIGP